MDIDQKKSTVNIGILETYGHIPLLHTFCKICNTKNTNITIFTTKELYNDLKTYIKKPEEYSFIVKKQNENYKTFLKRIEKICNQKIDLLFINTIKEFPNDLMTYISFKPKTKTIFTMHHVNTWLNPKFIFNMKKIRRTIKTNICSLLIPSFVLSKFNAINVIYPPLKEYIEKNLYYPNQVFKLPFSVYENNGTKNKKKHDNKIRIVSPGIIKEHLKDYSHVIQAFEQIFQKHKSKIKLYILGDPADEYGKKVYNEFNKMKQKGYDIENFRGYVPEETFDKILTESDLLLVPLKLKTRSNTEIEETYGLTVGSGVIFNAIQYAKPIIVPEEFNMINELKSSTKKYKNEKELEKQITYLIINPDELKKMKIEALNNAEKFSLKNQQDYFEKNILTWLKNQN
jgi:glycosyltransferase involved in cell wall biosynthesis